MSFQILRDSVMNYKVTEFAFSSYRIAGKFGGFGELSVIRQTKPIQISSYH